MKMFKYIYIILLIITILSCNEKDFLTEKPSSIYTVDNMYITKTDFESAINYLYYYYRYIYYTVSENNVFTWQAGTDLYYNAVGKTADRFGDYSAALDPTGSIPNGHWTYNYKLIANVNTILSRLTNSKLTDSEKLVIEAQAKFFRAAAYRTLTYLYGGIPLVLEEVSEAKVNFARDTKDACLKQIITDLEFCATNLPAINKVADGKLSNAAANHLLADVCLAAGEYDKAISAASAVINDPNFSLMTNRFGSQKNDPGDVYWDLFRPGNQNRSAGNKEGIFVIQFELDVPGGSLQSTAIAGAYLAERMFGPVTRDIKRLDNRTKTAGFLWPVSDYTGGRGAGQMCPTYYFTNIVWQDKQGKIDLNDIRNSQYNLPRYFKYNNPKGSYPLGTIFDCETNPECAYTLSTTGLWPRSMYPYQTKITTPGKHPLGLFQDLTSGLLYAAAGGTYTDWYDMRLGETYILRAEAKLAKGDKNGAAADLNILRARANASHIVAADVDINFILDERLRELGVEEKRRLTLMRLGKLYERVTATNPYNRGDIQPRHELFPIPHSAIEANTDAVLEQNPGYK